MTEKLLILSVVACGCYYILAYSRILAWLQPRYPRFLQELFSCSACSGFWLGSWGGLALHPIVNGSLAASVWISGLWCCTTTPILFKIMLTSLDFLAADLQANSEAEEEKASAPQEEV